MNPTSITQPSLIGCDIVFASSQAADYESFSGMVGSRQCRLHHVESCRETIAFLGEHPAGVVICQAELPDGTWRDLLDGISRLACAPNLIVASWLANDHLWTEVLDLGGYNVLRAPFDAEEAVRITAQAWADWNQRHSVAVRQEPGTAESSSGFNGKARSALAGA